MHLLEPVNVFHVFLTIKIEINQELYLMQILFEKSFLIPCLRKAAFHYLSDLLMKVRCIRLNFYI